MEDVKVEELDLYEVLDIELTSSVSKIKKAYRKKALKCHPDKNPDNPHAAKEFHHLSKILKILLHEKSRKAYDAAFRRRKEAALRTKELDSKRKKLKIDLEAREKRASVNYQDKDKKLQMEILRLRKEGSQQLQELEKMNEEIKQKEMAIEMERGVPSNPLNMAWINPPPTNRNSLAKPSDYESIVLTKMRQAEERRRLIEELEAETCECV